MRNAIIAPGRHGAPGGKSVVADVAHRAIGPPNAPIRDLGESPLLLPPPPLKEVCLFPLLFLFCLLLL